MFRFARRYSGNRICFLFLRVLRCFSSPGLPSKPYEFRLRYCSITNSGFPHSEILGSKLVRSSPRLIAAYHVLHRLSAPRHPPNALKALDHSHDRCPPPPSRSPSGGLTLIRKTIAARSFDRALACRTHPVKDAVTSSLVAKTRSLGYRACSLFTISNIRRPLARRRIPFDPDMRRLVEPDGIEPTTSCLQSRRSPN